MLGVVAAVHRAHARGLPDLIGREGAVEGGFALFIVNGGYTFFLF